MKKKPETFTFADLEPDAKSFIETKVRVLGSVGAVKRSYRLDDLVSRYALAYAERHFGPTGRPEMGMGRRRLSL